MMTEKVIERFKEVLDKICNTQMERIKEAALTMVDVIVGGRAIFSFGASHSFIVTQELVYRSGGLMLINPIYPHGMDFNVKPLSATSQIERIVGLGAELLNASPAREGDLLLISSTSGRNAVVIDMAFEAKRKGIKTIGITSLEYSRRVSSRHPSGRKLCDICDIVIDNCAPYGDAVVELDGFPQKICAVSTIGACAVAHCVVAEAVEELLKRGMQPPVFMSANLDGGDEFNKKLMQENSYRIFY